MSFLTRIFGQRSDPREALRPLWHQTIAMAREPAWYAECGAADTLEGRFDMVSAVTALVLLRMENDRLLAPQTGLLTELFVEDMDGQLRQSGVGDLMVGKKIGKLMSTLGGRIGAYRTALASDDPSALVQAVKRNITLADESKAAQLADGMRSLREKLARTDGDTLLDGQLA